MNAFLARLVRRAKDFLRDTVSGELHFLEAFFTVFVLPGKNNEKEMNWSIVAWWKFFCILQSHKAAKVTLGGQCSSPSWRRPKESDKKAHTRVVHGKTASSTPPRDLSLVAIAPSSQKLFGQPSSYEKWEKCWQQIVSQISPKIVQLLLLNNCPIWPIFVQTLTLKILYAKRGACTKNGPSFTC